MKRLACLAGTALVLAGCQHAATLTDDGFNARQRATQLSAIADWDLQGRLVVNDGERREALRASWQQRGDQISLTGRGAVGPVGGFRISGTAEQLVIETTRSDPETLENPERDLSDRLGWWMPVTSLEYWLLGQQDPGFPADVVRGPSGTLVALHQRDWRIDYPEYQLAEGLLVPRLIRFTHAELELELTVRNWAPAATQP